MTHFLDADFKPEYLDLAADVRLEDYYAKMMAAGFFATALAKQWDAAVAYLETRRLEPWTHNKTIQKARESYRISTEQKAYLRTLKRFSVQRLGFIMLEPQSLAACANANCGGGTGGFRPLSARRGRSRSPSSGFRLP